MLRRTFLFSAAAAVVASKKVNASSLGTLAWLQGGRLWKKNLPDGEPIALASGPALRGPAFSPSGRWIAFSDGSSLRLVSIDGKSTKSWQGASGKWAPGRDELVACYEAGNKTEILSEGKGWDAPLATIAGSVGAISPDGNYYASATSERSGGKLFIRLFGETNGPQPVAETPGYFENYGFTPDGQRLVYWMASEISASIEADGLELYSVGVNGQEPVKIGAFTLVHEDMLALSPAAGILAATDGAGRENWTNKSIVLADLSIGGKPGIRRLTGPGVSASHPSWSPDGAKLAWSQGPDADVLEKQQMLAAGQKTIKVIDPQTGIPREIPVTPKMRVGASDDLVQKCVRLRRIWTTPIGDQTVLPNQLTNDANYSDQAPLWSSDGSHILFARIDPAGAKSLWLMRSDGTDLQVVASLLTLEPPPRLANPVWGFYGYTPWRSFFDWSRSL
jgi:Tol biopolymer transport system component